MATYKMIYIDSDVPGGPGADLYTGSRFSVQQSMISVLSVEDDDALFDIQDTDDTPGIALNDPEPSGTEGFEVGEAVQFWAAFEVSGDDGSTGRIFAMSNFYGSGTQGYTFDFPITPGVTYLIGEMLDVTSIPYAELAVCFTKGTMILTADGETAVENLVVGDLVITADHGPQRIRWIGSKKINSQALNWEKLRPIRLRAGCLGYDVPKSDLLVSPHHRILLTSKIAQRMFSTQEILVAAKDLLAIDGVERAIDSGSVEYFHIMFDQHEVVISNGARTESLYAGAQALNAIGSKGRAELFELFPELEKAHGAPPAARPLVSGTRARKFATRFSSANRRKGEVCTGL